MNETANGRTLANIGINPLVHGSTLSIYLLLRIKGLFPAYSNTRTIPDIQDL